jgi:CubicO group peptidase (beta-lactamase class C family)
MKHVPRRGWLSLGFTAVLGLFALAATAEDRSSARFASLDVEFQKLVDEGRMPGDVILVLKDGKPLYSAAHGWADVDKKVPMQADTLFRIASMTKPVTSVAILKLVEDGKLAVSDPVSKFIPEFADPQVARTGDANEKREAASREVTVEDLLTHTSGIAYGFFSPPHYRQLVSESNIAEGLARSPLTVEESVARIGKLPLLHNPGERFTYGLNTDVLGRIVEVVSGQSLDAYLRTAIFEPLKMNDTYFLAPDDREVRRAVLYNVDPQKKAATAPDQLRTDLAKTSTDGIVQKYFSGGGGLVSTAPDYARFLQMLLNGGELDGVRVLKPETVALMTENHIGNLTLGVGDHGDKFGYGFGVWTPEGQKGGIPSVGSYSWSGAFGTYFWVDPHEKLVGILMVQISGPAPAPLRDMLKTGVYDAIRAPQ